MLLNPLSLCAPAARAREQTTTFLCVELVRSVAFGLLVQLGAYDTDSERPQPRPFKTPNSSSVGVVKCDIGGARAIMIIHVEFKNPSLNYTCNYNRQ